MTVAKKIKAKSSRKPLAEQLQVKATAPVQDVPKFHPDGADNVTAAPIVPKIG